MIYLTVQVRTTQDDTQEVKENFNVFTTLRWVQATGWVQLPMTLFPENDPQLTTDLRGGWVRNLSRMWCWKENFPAAVLGIEACSFSS